MIYEEFTITVDNIDELTIKQVKNIQNKFCKALNLHYANSDDLKLYSWCKLRLAQPQNILTFDKFHNAYDDFNVDAILDYVEKVKEYTGYIPEVNLFINGKAVRWQDAIK